MKGVSNRGISGKRDSAGIGYITIPENIDRDNFIEYCYRTSTITLMLENGGVIDKVLITKQSLEEVVFPEKSGLQGSQIVWVNQPRKQFPIAIGILSKNNEFVNFNKNKSGLRRTSKNFVSEVLVDAEKGIVLITSNSSIEGGGDIYIISTNKNKTSNLNVIVSQDVNFTSTNFNVSTSKKIKLYIKDKDVDEEITEISYEKGVGLSYKDEFKNECYINGDNIQFKPNSKFNVGSGKEPAMLSDTFKQMFNDYTDILSKLADSCAKIQVGTPMGPSTVPVNVADFAQASLDLNEIKNRYIDFQSKINFTD